MTRSIFDVHGSYADPTRRPDGAEHQEHGWDHGLGEIVTALIDAGLRIDRLEEQPFLEWPVDFLVEEEPGSDRWVLPEGPGELPLMFSLLASQAGLTPAPSRRSAVTRGLARPARRAPRSARRGRRGTSAGG